MKYPYGAISSSDPSNTPLGFLTQQEAQYHCDLMNSLRLSWEANVDKFWNKEYWKTQPLDWKVLEL